ncbi:hypothetical protein SAMN05216559_2484 [Halomicrobium zhouii]|uniref:Uncharacterized protein n=1 Tax=Halomicrobium zhouii TaxID=767519 RepID=A0A1I6LD52_9EURY|nr:hypothetical protein [Halomicrobium zhouii]SFS01347.1 hypothetical protein SAMN05216559_2484 [Halomicrobium zhouii]
MGRRRAAIYGILDATPFAIGLAIAVWSVGEMFAPGRLLLIALLLGAGVGSLLATLSASRYVADGTRLWLIRAALDTVLWWS